MVCILARTFTYCSLYPTLYDHHAHFDTGFFLVSSFFCIIALPTVSQPYCFKTGNCIVRTGERYMHIYTFTFGVPGGIKGLTLTIAAVSGATCYFCTHVRKRWTYERKRKEARSKRRPLVGGHGTAACI
ncbi:uncharacterized protein PV09_02103 [Verruconis gallopava]|uniref:Uncharacterized protein n=1 Tax=Verruconis gallopava TaxID=253628 RepID=A0A0D1Z2R3_9PEZI|nr:uncharacterized protein PV09_02103 [Verruconis gallopava]KIW07247.1 hypothetical protein PV09_02103 [Verruconis gallopava]